jgi:hypothetical protein
MKYEVVEKQNGKIQINERKKIMEQQTLKGFKEKIEMPKSSK